MRISVLCYRCSNWRPACLLVSSLTPLLFSFFLSLFCLFLFFLLSFANLAFPSCLLQHNIHTDNIKIINKYNKNINKMSLQRVHSASLGKANVFCTTKQSDHDSTNYKCFIWQVFKKDNVLIWISFNTNTTNNYKSFNKHKYTYISPVFSYFTNVWFFSVIMNLKKPDTHQCNKLKKKSLKHWKCCSFNPLPRSSPWIHHVCYLWAELRNQDGELKWMIGVCVEI